MDRTERLVRLFWEITGNPKPARFRGGRVGGVPRRKSSLLWHWLFSGAHQRTPAEEAKVLEDYALEKGWVYR
jgi:hypothetical protein